LAPLQLVFRTSWFVNTIDQATSDSASAAPLDQPYVEQWQDRERDQWGTLDHPIYPPHLVMVGFFSVAPYIAFELSCQLYCCEVFCILI
jgi:hypothetical protein